MGKKRRKLLGKKLAKIAHWATLIIIIACSGKRPR